MQRKFKFIMIMATLLLFCALISSASAAHVYNITDNSYSKYFSKSGYINNTSIQAGDTLDLSGPIKNKNMYINRPLNITSSSKTGQILNGTITILSGGSGTNVSNINIKNADQKGIVLFESRNNTIKDNTINVNEDEESYAIYLHDSRNNVITGNKLTNTGNYITIGILLYASNNNEIRSNKVNTTGTSVPLPYHSSVKLSQDIGAVKEIFPTYSILLLFSSDNSITGNDVVLKSGFSTPMAPSATCMNSMVGIDIYYDSNNNTVTGNQIKVMGNNPYSYGLGVLGSSWGTNSTSAEKNVFSHNTIDVTGSYFATGFIAGLNSLNTTINENIINVSADTYGYGVTLEASTGSTILKNIITTTASVNYAVELFTSHHNRIEENRIYPTGNYSMGIGTYKSGNNSIRHNTIITRGDTLQTPKEGNIHGDAIPAGNEGIKLYQSSNQNTIENNVISSSAEYAVNGTGSSNNTIINNYLMSDNGKKLGDAAVTRGTNDTVNGNYVGSPLADFTFKPTSGPVPLTVQFINRAIGIITGWAWDFNNDGEVDSTLQNPTYTYTKPGTYTVKLTLTGPNGTSVKTIAITVQPDTTAPQITSIDPGNGATKVAAGKTIKVTFNEAIKTGSNWIELKNRSGKAVPFKISINGNILTVDPTSNLAESLYTLIIHTGAVTDLAGNKIAAKTTKFSVGTPPKITKSDPANGATRVAANKIIKVTFNENIKKGSNWIELKNSKGKAIAFTSSVSGKVLNIKPKNKMAESQYRLIIHTAAVTDLAGNPVAAKTTKFSVGTAPKITRTDPKNGATKVAASKTIKVTFNENIKKGSKFWVELKNSAGKAIAFKASVSGKTLTIKPTKKLAESQYRLIIHTGAVTDLAGNPVAAKTTKFSVGTPPKVSKVDPKNGATKVARTKTIKVTFNEAIKAGSYRIELKTSSGNKLVKITKSIKGKTLTIKHTAKLKANTKYKLTLYTGSITDKAGNPMAAKTYTFNTGKT